MENITEGSPATLDDKWNYKPTRATLPKKSVTLVFNLVKPISNRWFILSFSDVRSSYLALLSLGL